MDGLVKPNVVHALAVQRECHLLCTNMQTQAGLAGATLFDIALFSSPPKYKKCKDFLSHHYHIKFLDTYMEY